LVAFFEKGVFEFLVAFFEKGVFEFLNINKKYLNFCIFIKKYYFFYKVVFLKSDFFLQVVVEGFCYTFFEKVCFCYTFF